MRIRTAYVITVSATCMLFACSKADVPETKTPDISCQYAKAAAGNLCRTGPMTKFQCTVGGGEVIAACPAGALLECPAPGATFYIYDQALVDLYKSLHPGNPCDDFASNG